MQSNSKPKGRIWLVGGQKGGPGKSTIAVNLAAALALSKRRAFLLDTDESGDANAWRLDRDRSLPRVEGTHETIDVAQTIKAAQKSGYEIVVDAGGRTADTLLRAMSVAELMLIPIRPSQFDLFSVKRMAKLVSEARCWNENLRALFFINQADARHDKSALEAREVLEGFSPSIPTAATNITYRSIWQHAARDSRAVFEMKNGDKASDEFWNLLTEIDPQLLSEDEGHGIQDAATQ